MHTNEAISNTKTDSRNPSGENRISMLAVSWKSSEKVKSNKADP